jgi:hypothetical protein
MRTLFNVQKYFSIPPPSSNIYPFRHMAKSLQDILMSASQFTIRNHLRYCQLEVLITDTKSSNTNLILNFISSQIALCQRIANRTPCCLTETEY